MEQQKATYDFAALERKWQAYWEEHKTFKTANPGEPGFDAAKPKLYILDMFPYPSGAGLHVGHPEGYTATDILARYRRMQGCNVLHPIGYDAFGLPAEQYAVEHGVHPAITTRQNIDNIRRQIKGLGFSYDWDRELATTDVSYYRWTQWIFRLLFESWYDDDCEWTDGRGRPRRGKARPIAELEVPEGVRRQGEAAVRAYVDTRRLAYLDEVPVNWCPALGTVLANEEVTNEGRSERGDHPVYRRPLRQWMLRITKYADRLEADLEQLDWPENIKIMQRNWIGRSEGAEAVFPLASRWKLEAGTWKRRDGGDAGFTDADSIRVFTTRPDTLFGATYMVLGPEHPLVEAVTGDAWPEGTPAEWRGEDGGTPKRVVGAYVEAARHKSDLARTAETKEKTGVFTGGYAINPVNGQAISIWVADYVLMSYGTGAIMAVPAHDTRDFEFAKKYRLPVVTVVEPPVSWLRDQLVARGVDAGYAERTGRAKLAAEIERSMHSSAQALSASMQTSEHMLDGDPAWIEQVALPLYREHADLLCEAFVGEGVSINSPPPLGLAPYPKAGAASSLPARALADKPPVAPRTGDRERLLDEEPRASARAAVPRAARAPALPEPCDLNGLPTPEAKKKITAWLEARALGRGTVNYKLRDWLFSRQRYWGEPIPVLHGEDGRVIPVPESELPVELPEMADFTPRCSDDPNSPPQPPLARAPESWRVVRRSEDGVTRTYRRELNTMPQWAGSCWYYLRYLDPRDDRHLVDKMVEKYWMPVDLYVGGAEHAVLHLLYARFWHKVLFDLGCVSTEEPFMRLFNQGMIRSFAYRDRRGAYVAYEEIDFREDGPHHKQTGELLTESVEKMAKSLKNVVDPDTVVGQYGADSLRLYEMYMGPLETSKPWNPRDVPGVFRFLQRCWRLVVEERTGGLSEAIRDVDPDPQVRRLLHRTIREVQEDLEAMKFNTAIAELIKFVNEMTPRTVRPRSVMETFVLLLSPFAPHLAEELWRRLKGPTWAGSLACEPWPAYDPRWARHEQVEIAVQINGKVKARLMIDAEAGEEQMKELALADERVAAQLLGRTIKLIKCVPGRLVSIVVQ